jgi:energy-coupling factor transport system ATP-binding protein
VEALSFAYLGAEERALSDVEFEAQPGSEVWITGPNASGKSTLLGVLAGVIPEVIEGELVGTVEVACEDGTVAARSMVMQDSGVYLFRSVHDEIAFVLQNRGVEPQGVDAAIADALELLGIAGLEHRLMHTLSGGERQKVAVCAALAGEPDLLLLDEPFEQLDPASAAQTLAVARGFVARGTTLVVATREAGRVLASATEVALGAGDAAGAGGAARSSRAEASPAEPVPATTAPRPPRGPRTPGEPLLRLERVTHRFGSAGGVSGVDLSVWRGESVALLGPNGAGKTTLMKHVNGLLRPQSGRVMLEGTDIAGRPVWETARTVGMLFQNPDDQIFNRTVLREVVWGLRMRGMSAAQAHELALAALEELGIAHLAEENPHETTASQRQLAAFASILVLQPALYVLDEPTKALDARAAELVAAAVDRRLAAGAGVLLVTHDLGFAERLADRSVLLVDGSVAREGSTAEVLADREALLGARLLG